MRIGTTVLITVMLATLALASAAGAGGRPFSTTLTGAEEAPLPGDSNATGEANLRVNLGQNEVCFRINWANVDGEVFAGHIHEGPPGDAGPIVVTLFTGSFAGTDSVSGCVEDVDGLLILRIKRNPSAFYVNVHSRPNFPGGAVRGQLGR